MRLEVRGLSKRFGGLQALKDVSLVAEGGAVTAIIGPNGAGKSTLLECLSGMIAFDEGEVLVDDGIPGTHPVRHIDRTRAVALGITRTFQNIRVFDTLTVEEHVTLARRSYLRTRRATRDTERPRRTAERLLDMVGLRPKARYYPAALSYGERRYLEIARGLATEPRVFLLDEPAAGSTLSEHARLAGIIGDIARAGVTVILVEHHMNLVAEVSRQVVVLNFGRVLTTGSIDAVRRDPEVISAYLGVAA